MHWTNKLLLSLCFLTASALPAAEPSPSLAKPLEPLRPFIGKTWKGEWVDGHEVTYEETVGAEVIFK